MKDIIVIGDIEMGAGNLTDDFISDHALSELIISLAKRKHPVDLVLNGDTFDFLKCPYLKDGKLKHVRHVTAEIAVNKLHLMYKAHRRVFQAFKEFSSHPGHHLYFIVGNHDHDLNFLEVRQELQNIISEKNVFFPGLIYNKHGIWVEHGQQYDFLNRANFQKLFVKHGEKSILNLPWITFSLLGHFMDMKRAHPFMERISPRKLMFSLHSMVLRKVSLRSIGYFLKSVLYYPFRFYSDPTYTIPTKLFGELSRRIKAKHWDVDEVLDVFKRKRKRKHKIVVLGHIHKMQIDEKRGRAIIHPGSWRDEYVLDARTRTLTPKDKYYVEITIRGENTNYKVVDYPIQRSVFLFDEVRKDELTYIFLAAREEDFKLSYT